MKVTGILTAVSDGTFWFETEDEKFYHITPPTTFIPWNEPITVELVPAPTGNFYAITSHEYADNEVLADPSPGNRLHIGMFKQVHPDSQDKDMERYLKSVQADARWVQDKMRFYYRDANIDVQVRGYVMRGEEDGAPPVYARNDIKKYIATHDMEGFEPNNFHVLSRYGSPGYCGQANRFGNYSVRYAGSGCKKDASWHEILHTQGLHHSGKYFGGNFSQYADHYAIMGSGSGTLRGGMNAVNIAGLNLAHTALDITESQQFLLAPIESSKSALTENVYQMAKLRSFSRNYYFSTRKVRASEYASGLTDERILFIHERMRSQMSAELYQLVPGNIVHLDGRTRVEYVGYSVETAEVRIELDDDRFYYRVPPSGTSYPINLGIAKDADEIITPRFNGAWYDPERNGQGFDVQIHEGMLAVYWYTFDSTKSRYRRFFTGACKIESNNPIVKLYETKNGLWNNLGHLERVCIGKAQLTFSSPAKGLFNYDTDEYGKGSIPLVPIATNTNPLSGSFYYDKRDGEGFSIQVSDDGEFCSAYFYSYPENIDKGQSQCWYSCQGVRKGKDRYVLKIFEVTDGKFLSFGETNLEHVGGLILKYHDVDNISATCNLHGQYARGSENWKLIRI